MAALEAGRLKIIAGRSHPALALAVAKSLKTNLAVVELGDFANGEINCRIEESVRGCDVFVLQTHSPDVNSHIMEQALIIDAAKRASARSITAVCPFLGYARQDRKAGGREPIAAKLVVDFLARSGADRIVSVDLHSGQIQGFFDGPFDHLIAMPVLRDYIKDKITTRNLVIVSPDAGRVKLTERYASSLGCDMAIIHKHRSARRRNQAEARYLIGDVAGRNCVIVDDMIDTAGTICAAANLLAENGAKKIYGLATHSVLSGPALERIEASAFSKVVVTDTLPVAPESKIEVVPVAPLIADSIAAIISGSSVSAIFEGHNQV